MAENPDLYCKTDNFAVHNGIVITEVSEEEGYAKGYMVVEEYHLNCNGNPHGGMYFTLADTVFGAATHYSTSGVVTLNSYADYYAAAKLGDTLTATARQIVGTRHTRRYEVLVRDQNDNLIMSVHCTGYAR